MRPLVRRAPQAFPPLIWSARDGCDGQAEEGVSQICLGNAFRQLSEGCRGGRALARGQIALAERFERECEHLSHPPADRVEAGLLRSSDTPPRRFDCASEIAE